MVDGQAHEDLGTVGLLDMRDEGLESLRLVLGTRRGGPYGGVMGAQVTVTMRLILHERGERRRFAVAKHGNVTPRGAAIDGRLEILPHGQLLNGDVGPKSLESDLVLLAR